MNKGSSEFTNLPKTYTSFIESYPELAAAHEAIANAADSAGPLDARSLSLVKLGICIGAGLETAFRSHVRRAHQNGLTWAELDQTVLQAMNTLGLPRTVMGWKWISEERRHIEDAT